MLTRKQLLCSSLLSLSLIASLSANGAFGRTKGNKENQTRLERKVRNLPDSLFAPVPREDLLNDEVYLKLAHEGWSREEIMTIMGTALADKKAAKKKIGYGNYAKQWLPTYGRQPGGDTLYMFIDTLYNEKMRKSVAANVPEDLLNAYWPPISYIPPKLRTGAGQENQRIGGYFRCPQFKPFCGRIYWMAVNPDNPDRLYAVPDGAGIYKTDNLGEHWVCITDKIPDRANRSNSPGYAIPVDPDDWDHVFAFMNNSTVYETTDGGESWRRIQGATHKSFKRGDCFRDSAGNLKFIGCTNRGWGSKLWISEDTCKTWTEVVVPQEMKDINPSTGVRGLWFQYIVFDPTDRNKIYLPTSRSIFYFDDGAQSTTVDGQKTYNIKKMSFEVYDFDHNVRRYPGYDGDKGADPDNNTIFPCPATTVGDLIINPRNPSQWWFATGSYLIPGKTNSAVYRSDDGGRTWVTCQDLIFGIGRGGAYGNELANTWLGGFGVNFARISELYGCSMSSAYSPDNGKTFLEFPWGTPIAAKYENGQYIAVSAARHNADNHFIRSHKTGRIFRGSDGGLLMKEPNPELFGTHGNWISIGGDMGQMLFYHIAVNEFGDQVMAGNTQDLDGQTYRYGRWTKWRGYEGSESFINPYTSAVYFPNMGTQGLDPNMINIDSWQTGTTRADVVTGSWYTMRTGSKATGRTLLRCDDLGQKLVNLEPAVGAPIDIYGKFGLCRDKGRSTIYVITKSHVYKRSIDNGNTFETLKTPSGADVKFTNSVLATDPNNSDILYIGLKGGVYRYDVMTSTTEKLGGESLPDIPCTNLLFHEGSGDLYFYHAGSAGFYILEYNNETGEYAPEWRYWTKGYNASKASNVEINYTSQEMVLCDYGHSVWVADLEHPSDRYFKNGFNLKELSFKNGCRTIGIDTEWTIPLYYNYKWTVNGEVVDNPYQYLHRVLNGGDRVQLELTLRESPDVHTLSSVFIVPNVGTPTEEATAATANASDETATEPVSFDTPITKIPGHALYSNGKGRIDLGYTDYFHKDFTIDFWLKPNGNGTILSNTTRHSDAKGFELSVDGDALKFQYYPLNQVIQPYYETAITQNAVVRGGTLKMGQWHHIAVTQQREGNIVLYVNGEQAASAQRINPEGSLNNIPVLSLFADAIEKYPIEAAVDELKIWDRALTTDEVRREMYSTNVANEEGLVAYYPFNSGSLENEREVFTDRRVKSRVLAEVQYPLMSVPICAKHTAYDAVSGNEHIFRSDDLNLVKIAMTSAADENAAPASMSGNIGVYAFDASQWQNEEDNIDTDFFDYYPLGYLVHTFDQTEADGNLSLEFYPAEGEFAPEKNYRLYAADINSDKQAWKEMSSVVFNPETGSLAVSDLKLQEITDKKLLIVATKPSIELHVEGMGADGVLSVYDESQTVFPLTAIILSGLNEPEDVYQINPDGIVKASGLYFAQGKASGELRLDLSKLGTFNSSVRATLRSDDNPVELDGQGNTRPSLIPLPIDVRNRIMPRELGTALKIVNGRADIGNSSVAGKIDGSCNATIMGWIRIDSLKNINASGFNLLTFQHLSGNNANSVSGLRVNRGQIEYFQNLGSRHKSANLTYTAADLGVWRHLAVVLDSVSGNTTIYMNGVPQTFRYSAPFNPVVGFHIGKNSAYGVTANTDNFCGAVDQVGVWKRALSQDEIIKYMYMTPTLDDPNMIYYLNMDYTDDGETMRDCCSLAEIKTLTGMGLTGSASFDEPITIPFDARSIVPATAADSPIQLTFPTGMQRDAVVATFRGTPYCYLNHDYQSYSALAQEFYGITYRDFTNVQPSAEDSVILTYRHRTIVDGEKIAVALRKTGTAEHLAGFIHASSVIPGEAVFRVPASFLTHASEIMFFTYLDGDDDASASRLANIQLGFPRSIVNKIQTDGDIPTIMLTDDMDSIPLIADIFRMAHNNDNPVRIIVNESTYATSTQDTIDFSQSENRFDIRIDMNKIDPFGLNPLTVNLEGAEANEIKLNFYLEPYVHLTLQDGKQGDVITPESNVAERQEAPGARRARLRKINEIANTITATTSTSILEVNAEMLQGYMPEGERVQLEVLTDLDYSMNIGNGTLFHNKEVSIGNLDYQASESGAIYEGWNLIGNPYLTNINLTKSKNVEFNPERVTKFIYQCDPLTGNYRVYDMIDYNPSQRILPFQSYFVQTMEPDASLVITPIAGETEPTKRTLYYDVVEKRQLVLELSEAGNVLDEVTVVFDYNSNNQFEVNEDAPKMWNLTASSPELYAVTADDVEVAVNVTGSNEGKLGVKSPDRKNLTLSVKSMTGIEDGKVIVHDNVTGDEWKPMAQGNSYEFTAETGVDNNRFHLTLKDISTGLDRQGGSAYKIGVDDGSCIISGLQGNAIVNIFNVSGMNVVSMETREPILTLTLERGVYIVVIRENGKEYTSKIRI